jgi:hypothetical protein
MNPLAKKAAVLLAKVAIVLLLRHLIQQIVKEKEYDGDY